MTSVQKLWSAAVLNLVLIASLLVSCVSCATVPHGTRSVAQQHNAAVRIKVFCGDSGHYGTGVIVSKHHILTAHHVAQCEIMPGVPIYVTPDKVVIDPGDNVEREATVELTLGDGIQDIARLKTEENLSAFMSPITVGPAPAIGDKVCEASAVPRWTYRCGTAQDSDGYIRMEMRTEHGNSGSGLYDAQGRLIGIVVQLWVCEANEFCGGKAAPIQDLRYLVP
jgi:S1-C subfamily serine protease